MHPMILLNDFQRQWRDTEASVMQTVRAIGANGWYVLGAEVRAFESEIAATAGSLLDRFLLYASLRLKSFSAEEANVAGEPGDVTREAAG